MMGYGPGGPLGGRALRFGVGLVFGLWFALVGLGSGLGPLLFDICIGRKRNVDGVGMSLRIELIDRMGLSGAFQR